MSETTTEAVTETSAPPPPPPPPSEPPSDILPPRDGAWTGMSLEAKIGALDDAVRVLEQTVQAASTRLRRIDSVLPLVSDQLDESLLRDIDQVRTILYLAEQVQRDNPSSRMSGLRSAVLDILAQARPSNKEKVTVLRNDLLAELNTVAQKAQRQDEAAAAPEPSKGETELSPAVSPNIPAPAPAGVLPDSASQVHAFDERQLGGVLGADGQVHSDADPGL